MPLESGAKPGSPGFGRNVATEIEAGKPQRQAVAIAYSKARGDAAGLMSDRFYGYQRDLKNARERLAQAKAKGDQRAIEHQSEAVEVAERIMQAHLRSRGDQAMAEETRADDWSPEAREAAAKSRGGEKSSTKALREQYGNKAEPRSREKSSTAAFRAKYDAALSLADAMFERADALGRADAEKSRLTGGPTNVGGGKEWAERLRQSMTGSHAERLGANITGAGGDLPPNSIFRKMQQKS